MNGVTTVVLKAMISAVEKRRAELETASDVREVVVTVTMKTGAPGPHVRFTTTSVECGSS